MVDVIMKNNTTAQAKDVMPGLIQSAVQNVIENADGLDLNSAEGLEEVGEMISYHLEYATGEKVDIQVIIKELKRQLR